MSRVLRRRRAPRGTAHRLPAPRISALFAAIVGAVCMVALAPGVPSAHAVDPTPTPTTGQVTHTASVDVGSFPATHDVQLPQFDDQGGTLALTEIEVSGWVQGSVDGSLKNLSTSQNKTLSAYVDANISLTGLLAEAHANAHDQGTWTLTPGQKISYSLAKKGTFDATSTDSSVLSGFVGDGTITYPVQTDVTTQVTGPAPYLSTGIAVGSAEVTITYDYTTVVPTPTVQTEGIYVYQCENGAPSTDAVAATVADSTEPISATAAPVVNASVAAGPHATTAVVGSDWEFVACGQTGVSVDDAQHASQSITVPPGGHADAVYYVKQAPPPPTSQTESIYVYQCQNGSPTTTAVSATVADSTEPIAATAAPVVEASVQAGNHDTTAQVGSDWQFVSCGQSGVSIADAQHASQSISVPAGGHADAVYYVKPVTQTESILVYQCVNGAPSTTAVAATVADSTEPIAATAAPVVDAGVKAGSHDTTAQVGSDWQFVACGRTGVTIADGQHASQSVTVPVGGHADAIYYVKEVPPPPVVQTESVYVYECQNGSPTTTTVPATVADTTEPIAPVAAPIVNASVAAGPHATTAQVGSDWQFVACGKTGVTIADGQHAAQSITVPSGGHAEAVYYVKPVVQTESIYVYQCQNGSPTTTAVPATVADSTQPIAATAAPVVDASVAAGSHATTAQVAADWQFVACGKTGVTIADGQHAAQSITVPSGGHAEAVYYVKPVVQTESIYVYQCQNGSPTTTAVPATVGDTTQPIAPTAAPVVDASVSAGSHNTTAQVGSDWQFVACGKTGVTIGDGQHASSAINVPVGGHADAIYYVKPVTQTESILVYQCVNGSPTTTAVSATVADTTQPIAATAAPVLDASVTAGSHTTTATVGSDWMFVACGQTGVTTTDDQHASQSANVPPGGHVDIVYYVKPVPPPVVQTESIYVYQCVNGSPTTTAVPGTVADTTQPIAATSAPLVNASVAAGAHSTTAQVGSDWTFVACGKTGVTISDGQHASQSITVPSGGHADAVYYVTPTPCSTGTTQYKYHRALTVSVWKELYQEKYDSTQKKWVSTTDGKWYKIPEAYGAKRTYDVTSGGETGTVPAGAYPQPSGYPPFPGGKYRFVVDASSATDVVATWSADTDWLTSPPALPSGTHGFGWVVDQTQTVGGTCTPPPTSQTESIYVYQCVNGSPTTTAAPGTVADTTEPIAATTAPLVNASVKSGTHSTTAQVGSDWTFVACGKTGVTIADGQHASQSITVPSGGHADAVYYVTPTPCSTGTTQYKYHRALTVSVWKELYQEKYDSTQKKWVTTTDGKWYKIPEAYGAKRTYDVTSAGETGTVPAGAYPQPSGYPPFPGGKYRFVVDASSATDVVATWSADTDWLTSPPALPSGTHGFGWVVDQTQTVGGTCSSGTGSGTGWAGGGTGGGSYNTTNGSWATYVKGPSGTWNVYVGQTNKVGTVTISNGTMQLNLTSGTFEGGGSNVQVQGYSSPPSGNPSPGQFQYQFTCSGTSCTAHNIAPANYYGIHLGWKAN